MQQGQCGKCTHRIGLGLVILGIIGIIAGIVTKKVVEGPVIGTSDFALLLGLGMLARNSLKSSIALLVMAIATTATVFVKAAVGFYPAIACERYWGAAGLNIGYLTITAGLIFVCIHVGKRLGFNPQ